MKQAYITKNLSAAKLAVIAQANEIIEEYTEAGYVLTLRQLYYQFVARGLRENTQRSYKNLGGAVIDGRRCGLIDWDCIEDLTRNLKSMAHWESPQEILDDSAYSYHRDLWETQPHYCEVWVEKDALIGVIGRACRALDVPYFACRGYTSDPELRLAGKRLKRERDAGKRVHIFHLGDHDPSGIDMTRDVADRLAMFMELPDFMVERLALNMPQVDEYGPPPNPAKLTDSRCAGYVERFGNESWELDALRPEVIEELISDAVGQIIDPALWAEASERQEAEKAQLHNVSENWQQIVEDLD